MKYIVVGLVSALTITLAACGERVPTVKVIEEVQCYD